MLTLSNYLLAAAVIVYLSRGGRRDVGMLVHFGWVFLCSSIVDGYMEGLEGLIRVLPMAAVSLYVGRLDRTLPDVRS